MEKTTINTQFGRMLGVNQNECVWGDGCVGATGVMGEGVWGAGVRILRHKAFI